MTKIFSRSSKMIKILPNNENDPKCPQNIENVQNTPLRPWKLPKYPQKLYFFLFSLRTKVINILDHKTSYLLESRKAIDAIFTFLKNHNSSAQKSGREENLNQNHHIWHNICVICLLQMVLVHPHTIHRRSHHH